MKINITLLNTAQAYGHHIYMYIVCVYRIGPIHDSSGSKSSYTLATNAPPKINFFTVSERDYLDMRGQNNSIQSNMNIPAEQDNHRVIGYFMK